MRILIGAVGRMKAGPERTLAEDYLSRSRKIARQAGITAIDVTELPESAGVTAALRKDDEALRLLAALPSGAAVLALDEDGENVTSEDLARFIEKRAEAGTLAFLIGGPDGHGKTVRERAERRIAFGRATWPHRLVRVLLLEQVYRSVTILLNHPYHRA
ncbi:MAG: 23S rRNA (pseudouridine(1915)-N(3))-methyltransferase RlmH [Parvibaculaceae bacterium]